MTVKFVRSKVAERRLGSVGAKEPKLGAAQVAAALGATRAGGSRGLDLEELRDALEGLLSSTGGRPGLIGAERQAKIPRYPADWAKFERAAGILGDLAGQRPSTTQIAALLLHFAAEDKSAEDIVRIIAKASRPKNA